MSELELITMWSRARKQMITSQLGPIFLLTSTVVLLRTGLADADLGTRLAAALILLATGALGSAVQFSVSSQAIAIARDLRDASATSHAARTVIAAEGLTNLIRYAIPALFVVIYVVILVALFA
ncbi:hypothetical protein DOU17_08155 [Clavibacter michiganensis subsp. michiganensis]|uniref:hypothetical protein n=1 Tax=Clavibacter michiganensis TaxID=28447 RepID=UPI000B757AA5|nr:hypothetical protein [Clavibacter michiganensis]MWJ18894.1 hypothetical protein [Clavibacter michiganensis subsp. michiganensis]OUD98868.1 hypothetical protein CMMCAS06_11795 [Clavibacter michiganensis subsp. michiganensis]OUE05661.1 hypothetical protein CMMCAS08_02680 [Clavibacter michiganensis subsp. michiganensis]